MATIDFSRLFADLDAYTQRLQQAAIDTSERASMFLQQRLRERASNTPGWDQMADNIEVWSQDGRMVVGMTDSMMASQAFQLEYGDEVTPPSPLFRSMSAEVGATQAMANAEMSTVFGPERLV